MSKLSIVPKLTAEELSLLFRKEAKISANGSVGFSRRGVERLTGVSNQSLLRLLEKIKGGTETCPESLKAYAGVDFEGAPISEGLVYDLICYYSESDDKRHSQSRIRCNKLIKLFGAIGLRKSVHIAQNWETNQSPTDSIAYRYLLPEPRAWDKQFPDEFYSHLERLTQIYPKGANRPHYWAKLTNEFVYDYLPKAIADGVRQAKAANDSFDKLHQYLSPDGLELLKKHLEALLILLSAASSVDDVRSMATRRFSGQYQLGLKLK
jgi:hypothetical protein